MNILCNYRQIMTNELHLRGAHTADTERLQFSILESFYALNTTQRLIEISYNSTIMRAGNIIGHLTGSLLAFESDGGHTNLVRSIVKYAIDSIYGWDKTSHRFNRNVFDEAVVLHDLAENETGDIPDNRNRDEQKKIDQETAYLNHIITTYGDSKQRYTNTITRLLQEMQDKSSIEGRLLYMADKISAIIMMLVYDRIGLCPRVYPGEPSISKISTKELVMCTKQQDGSMLLSELWTIDYLYGRNLMQYDDSGFFTSLVVMATLLTHGEWYYWREQQYR